MKNRLIELLKQRSCVYVTCDRECGECHNVEMYDDAIESIADHLIANGVIVPPCKVGDIVYSINRKALEGHFEDNRYIVDGWSEYKVCEIPFSLTLWECGWKGIFLTREEAEKALAERSNQ